MGNLFGKKKATRVTEQDRAVLLWILFPLFILQVQDIEFAQIEMKVFEGLKVGNDCLKKMHEVLSLEEVERIMDETHDSIEYQKQIDEMLAGSLTQEDEEAVLAELEAITQGEADLELPEVPEEELPEVPEQEPGLCFLLFYFCGNYYTCIAQHANANKTFL
uniref:Charged multivesicular body protein 6-like n=1 Tax=Sinocyclocheilus grahami TaxID=75366 RepID=A0A672KDZ7_SINGR